MNDDIRGFFEQREWLEYTYLYARSHRVSPWGLAATILSRVSALTPPNVVAQLTPTDLPMSLNYNTALVGPTGSGKGKSMALARHLVPAPILSPFTEIKPKTGESIPAKFIDKIPMVDAEGKTVKGEYTDKCVTDRCLVFVPEIVSLRAAMSKQGSNLLPTLLEAFSNEPLGDDTKGKQYQIKLPPYSYRLSGLVGVQPNNSGVIFDEANTGLAGRFVFMPSTDPDAPETRPQAPSGPFPFSVERLPEGNSLVQVEELCRAGSRDAMGGNGYPLVILQYPGAIAGQVDGMQRNGVTGNVNALDSHRPELIGKLAALFSLMEQRDLLGVSEDDWEIATSFMNYSDIIRADTIDLRKAISTDERADRIAAEDEARRISEAKQVQVCCDRILTVLATHDPQRKGMKGYLIRRQCGKYGYKYPQAIDTLVDFGSVKKVGGDDSTTYTLAT